jgi:predicted ribosome quality control (RQC) complex YloA/Tae2 family protein
VPSARYEGETDTLRRTMATTNSRNPDDQARLLHYTLPGGWIVLAGRTDADNDRLSLTIAKPNDWWFHVRGMPGSHVLLRARRGDEPDRATLKRAAAIAAYHSKARTAGLVAVSCTRARYVTKPRGAKPGAVEIRKEVILKVRPQAPEATASDDSEPASRTCT